MKNFLIAILLIPAFCQAQIEFGVNAGLAPLLSSSDKSEGNWTAPNTSKWPKSGAIENATISVAFLHSLKAGLGYELSAQLNKMTSAFAFINYGWTSGKSELYTGVAAGTINFKNNIYTQCTDAGHGLQYDIHAGYSYNIVKGICINIQVAYGRISASASGTGNYEGGKLINVANYLSTTIGLHYKLNLSTKK